MPLTQKREVISLTKQRQGANKIRFCWHPDGTLVVTHSRTSNLVSIWDRTGVEVASFALKTPCVAAEWDPAEGSMLAAAMTESPVITLWDARSRKSSPLDSGLKAPITTLGWSPNGASLAMCSNAGTVAIYSKRNQRRKIVKTGLSSPISHCAWSSDNSIALTTEGSDVAVISEQDGEIILSTAVKGSIGSPLFSAMKTDRSEASKFKENTLSFVVGSKTVYLFTLDDPDNPVELAFQAKYGKIVCHAWFGDGYLMLGFSAGYFVVIGTSPEEIGQELHSVKLFSGPVTCVLYNDALKRAAVCGDQSIKLLDSKSWKSSLDVATIPKEQGPVDQLGWTKDGQILSASTDRGFLSGFLTKIPALNATSGTSVAYLSSLRTLCISEMSATRPTPKELQIAVEPSFVALGPLHAAVGLNNKAWFHPLKEKQTQVIEQTYPGSVESMVMNASWAAALYDGKVMLHAIGKQQPGGKDDSKTVKIFPEKEGDKITDLSITSDFLIYGTSAGTISLFYIPDWNTVIEYHHTEVNKGIKWLFPNPLGTRVIFVDTALQGFLYNPVNDSVMMIPDWTESVINVLWDKVDTSVFITSTSDTFLTYNYTPITLAGPRIQFISKTSKPPNSTPLLSVNGSVVTQDGSGGVSNVQLSSHVSLVQAQTNVPLLPEKRRQQFGQALKLNRIREAWSVAQKLNNQDCWTALGKEALSQLDIPLAIIAYRQLGDAGMVDSLEQISTIEDVNLLAAQVNMLWGNYNEAQRLFLLSSEPLRALQMRRDLMHWEQATQLAKTIAPQELPSLSAETAQQLEFKGDHQGALEMYLAGVAGAQEGSEQYQRCAAGAARMTLRVGDLAKGMILAQSTKSPVVLRDCAMILESLKQFTEAAQLYVQAGMFDKAALIYIKTRQSSLLREVMPKVTNPTIHAQYAKAREEEGDFAEAERSYAKAKDTDSVIRLILKTTKTPERAFQLVRETRSQDGARMAAEYCQKIGDFRSAIEFLLMAKLFDDAFAIAQQHESMDKFCEVVGDTGTEEQYCKIAEHYENRGDFPSSGKFYAKCQQYAKALKLFLRSGESCALSAIDVVGQARDDSLTRVLIDYLMGDVDGVPKDPNYIFRLYMALGNYLQAARTALIISRQEQELGNYKVAQAILLDTFRVLDTHNIKVVTEIRRNLYLLHGYVLAKLLIKNKQHELAARLLIRIARNISKFPSHTVPILTTAAIECYRVGLKKTAFEFATQLVAPEYHKDIPASYKRPIEQIVRKMEKGPEKDEPTTPCPACGAQLFQSELDCPQCKNFLPFCIVTGQHMVLEDWCYCPSCSFPALYSQFAPWVASKQPCPMCEEVIDPASIHKESDPTPLLRKAIESVDITQLDQPPK